jgi:hypothetical protein
MTENDIRYIRVLIEEGVIVGPVLELGAAYGGVTCRDLVVSAGLEYDSTDMVLSKGVSYAADFSSAESVSKAFGDKKYGSVFVLNVLEHTFDPIRVLDGALSLVESGGRLVVITPTVWTLHNYPIDCCRLLPNWYEQYVVTREIRLLTEHFDLVGYGKVRSFANKDGSYSFPTPAVQGRFKYWRSRVVQYLFRTYGRGMAFPSHIAIGGVYVK